MKYHVMMAVEVENSSLISDIGPSKFLSQRLEALNSPIISLLDCDITSGEEPGTHINDLIKKHYNVTIVQCPSCSVITTNESEADKDLTCAACKFTGHCSEFPDFIY